MQCRHGNCSSVFPTWPACQVPYLLQVIDALDPVCDTFGVLGRVLNLGHFCNSAAAGASLHMIATR